MQTHRRWISLSFAIVNLIAAVMMLRISWQFRHEWDTPGGLHQIKSESKDEMLRVIHNWGMPTMAVLTSVSGILLWRFGRQVRK